MQCFIYAVVREIVEFCACVIMYFFIFIRDERNYTFSCRLARLSTFLVYQSYGSLHQLKLIS